MNTHSLHFNYTLQVWVIDGKVKECNHPQAMKAQGCCNGYVYRGLDETHALQVQILNKEED